MSTPKGNSTAQPGADAAAELKTALQLQGQIDECAEQLRKLEAAHADNRRRADALRAGLPTLTELGRQRQYVAAGVSLGTATKADLEDMDEQLREAHSAHDKAERDLVHLDELAGGIEQHRAEWQSRLQTLKHKHAEAVRRYLRAEIEGAGAVYAELAIELKAAYKRLCGLCFAFSDLAYPGEPARVPRGIHGLQLPGFNLKSVNEATPAMPGDVLFPSTPETGHHERQANTAKAIAAVAATGLRRPDEQSWVPLPRKRPGQAAE